MACGWVCTTKVIEEVRRATVHLLPRQILSDPRACMTDQYEAVWHPVSCASFQLSCFPFSYQAFAPSASQVFPTWFPDASSPRVRDGGMPSATSMGCLVPSAAEDAVVDLDIGKPRATLLGVSERIRSGDLGVGWASNANPPDSFFLTQFCLSRIATYHLFCHILQAQGELASTRKPSWKSWRLNYGSQLTSSSLLRFGTPACSSPSRRKVLPMIARSNQIFPARSNQIANYQLERLVLVKAESLGCANSEAPVKPRLGTTTAVVVLAITR